MTSEFLDFSELTNDQLLGLLRALLREAVARGDAASAAARAACLDEQEKAQIFSAAAGAEAARLRALERERVAKEAAEAVRREHAEQERVAQEVAARATAERAAEAGREAAHKAWQLQQEEKRWLSRAADLLGRKPSEISLLYLSTRYGWRVLINEGCEEYQRDHLVDWHVDGTKIKTCRHLVAKKQELIAFCAEFRAAHKSHGPRTIYGNEHTWEIEPCQTT